MSAGRKPKETSGARSVRQSFQVTGKLVTEIDEFMKTYGGGVVSSKTDLFIKGVQFFMESFERCRAEGGHFDDRGFPKLQSARDGTSQSVPKTKRVRAS